MLLALPLSLLLAAASATTSSDAPPIKRAALELFVNDTDQGVKTVILRGEDILVRDEDLTNAGLRDVDGARERIGELFYVPLSTIPNAKFELDPAALAVRLHADPKSFAREEIDLGAMSRPANLMVSRDNSAFFNYALTLDTDKNVGGTGELGASFSGNLLLTSVSSLPGQSPVRGLTSLTQDDPDSMRRIIVGDQIASTGVLGGAMTVAGAGVSREFSLNPYFARYQLPALTGSTSTPSTLEIYVNGVLVKREPLAPGVYSLSNLPVSSGSGVVRTVVRDAFGEVVTQSPYYFTNGLLTRGLSDYSYVIGAQRNDLGTSSFSYGAPMLLARHRLGLTDSLTGGFRLEAGVDRVSLGPSADFLVPFGELQIDLAASRQGDFAGTAASLAFTSTNRFFSLSADVRNQSRFYSTASQDYSADRARLESSVLVSVPLASRLSATASYSASLYRDHGFADQASAGMQLSLAAGASLVANVGVARNQGSPDALTGMLLFVYSFGKNMSASLAAEQENSQLHAIAQLQRSMPLGEGYGYQLQADASSTQGQTAGTVVAQSQYGRYELDYSHNLGVDSTTATLSGGLVAMDGKVFATRPVQQSFALVQVPGVEGIHSTLENQEMGSTDKNGDLLIPNMLPYYGGNIRIATDDLPLGYIFNRSSILAAPAYRSGALVTFAVHRVHGARGNIFVSQGATELETAFGEMSVTVDGKEVTSPIGHGGAFYFENLPEGVHTARVDLAQGSCQVRLDLTGSKAAVLGLGNLRCELALQVAGQ